MRAFLTPAAKELLHQIVPKRVCVVSLRGTGCMSWVRVGWVCPAAVVVPVGMIPFSVVVVCPTHNNWEGAVEGITSDTPQLGWPCDTILVNSSFKGIVNLARTVRVSLSTGIRGGTSPEYTSVRCTINIMTLTCFVQ